MEIEFASISAHNAAIALAAELSGNVLEKDPHAFLVRRTRLGDLAVKLDLRHTHPQRRTATRLRLGRRSAAWLGSLLRHFDPTELVFAPLPVFRLAEVDQAVAALRRAGATGRGTTLLAFLGLHFNVEASRLDAEAITAVLKSFALLEPWLRRKQLKSTHEWLNRLGECHSETYVRRVVSPYYWPNLTRLSDDYLVANPTRRRDLDLLPLMLLLDEVRVRARLPHEKISASPAFHYRLPHAHVGEAIWSLLADWDGWVAVERLAAQRQQLDAL